MTHHRRTSGKGLALLLALAASALTLTAFARYQIERVEGPDTASIREVLLVPPGRVIRQIDLGSHTLAADLLFIRANLYYGQHISTDEKLPWLADFIDVLIEVDPDFKKTYTWGSLATLYYKRQIDSIPLEVIERANRILERGMRRFPHDHIFPMRIGFNYYYEVGDREKAVPYFQRAADLPGSPAWIRKKLIDILKNDPERARRLLVREAMISDDPNLSPSMQARMAHWLPMKERQRIERLRSKLMTEWQTDWPSLSFDLFLLVREP
jgi:hypothetical protein